MIIIPEDGLCPVASYITDKQHLTILCSLEHSVTAVWVLTAATSKLQRSRVSIFLLVISYDFESTLMGQLASDARNSVQISSTLSWTSFWGSAFSCCTASQNLQQFVLCVINDSNTLTNTVTQSVFTVCAAAFQKCSTYFYISCHEYIKNQFRPFLKIRIIQYVMQITLTDMY